jgi:hypothetical protein
VFNKTNEGLYIVLLINKKKKLYVLNEIFIYCTGLYMLYLSLQMPLSGRALA